MSAGVNKDDNASMSTDVNKDDKRVDAAERSKMFARGVEPGREAETQTR